MPRVKPGKTTRAWHKKVDIPVAKNGVMPHLRFVIAGPHPRETSMRAIEMIANSSDVEPAPQEPKRRKRLINMFIELAPGPRG